MNRPVGGSEAAVSCTVVVGAGPSDATSVVVVDSCTVVSGGTVVVSSTGTVVVSDVGGSVVVAEVVGREVVGRVVDETRMVVGTGAVVGTVVVGGVGGTIVRTVAAAALACALNASGSGT